MIAVSACLAGEKCRYDGRSAADDEIVAMVGRGEALTVCPESLGGLPVPRQPAEIVGDAGGVLAGCARVLTADGGDVTEAFVKGAEAALDYLKARGVTEVILKANSPSCGCGLVYDGTFSSRLTSGNGVAAELFLRNGVKVSIR